ncbi:15177_t:CDS:1, partial [Funneliformis caledonium]
SLSKTNLPLGSKKAKRSRYNIILTDVTDLYLDLVQFVEERQIEAQDVLVRFIEERQFEIFYNLFGLLKNDQSMLSYRYKFAS